MTLNRTQVDISWLCQTNAGDSGSHVRIATFFLAYQPDPDFYGTDILSLSVDDQGNTGSGGPKTAGDTAIITVSPVNDTQVVGAPAALSAMEQIPVPIHGTGFTAIEVDEAGAMAVATLLVGEGTITVLEGDSDVLVTAGNGTGTVTFTGTIAQIDNLLTGASTGTITYLNDRCA